MKASFESPALLKSIELQGYKTFATKTEFAFAPTITAIVGPNGVGKSNIADAIRWVLGEQSYRLLRAKRTEDVIFTGSDTRPRAGMASANIVFDNSEGWLPIDFSEVSVGRRAYRDGTNEYLLNGQRVRLRDLVELLSECGLAERTYTIIGQGLVDTALSLRAEERRRLFEEAAGIGLYRIRRQEATRRLETAARNLERAQDILAELKPRLRSLERQARRARNYDQVRTDLREALRIWYGFHWHAMQSEVMKRRQAAGTQEAKRDDLRLRHEKLDTELVETRRSIDKMRGELHDLSQEISRLYSQRESRGRRLAIAQERGRWLIDQSTFLNSELATLEERHKVLVERKQRAQQEVDRRHDARSAAESTLEDTTPEEDVGRKQRIELVGKLRDLQGKHEKLQADRAAWEAQLGQLSDAASALTERQQALGKDLSSARTALHDADAQVSLVEGELERAQRNLDRASKALKSARARESDLESKHEASRLKVVESRTEIGGIEARLEALQHSLRSSERVAENLGHASKKGALSGWVGVLSEALKTSPKYRQAISSLLGILSQGVVFKTDKDVVKALDWLADRTDDDRAALLPLAPLHDPPLLEAPESAGVEGNAAELTKVAEPYRKLANILLGQALVVKDRSAAVELIADLPTDGMLVTLSGEVFYPSGVVVLGARQSAAEMKARISELEASLVGMKDAFSSAEKETEGCAADLETARKAREEAQKSADDSRNEEGGAQLRLEKTLLAKQEAERQLAYLESQREMLDAEIAQLAEKRQEVEARGANFDLERESIEAELDLVQSQLRPDDDAWQEYGTPVELATRAEQSARGRLSEIDHELKALEHEMQDWQGRISSNQVEQTELNVEIASAGDGVAEVEKRLEEISTQSEPVERAIGEAEDNRAKLEADESLTRSLLQEAERSHSQLQIDLARREEELASLRRRIEDDFGLVTFEDDGATLGQEPLPLDGLVERLPRVDEVPIDLQTQIGRLRAQLRRMGAINPEAQREYEEVRERVDFLTQQLEDSQTASAQIRDVIAELDVLMEREFRKTFEAVAKEFRATFTRLFGGGSARLVLTDAEDFTSIGIDIEAKLPGRREQGLAVLSGGERSLTATALIFALLKVSPTPFCVLDEVDAMLDEANVVRFIEMLRELSKETQFILITHNRQTVQAAEVIYGISMGNDQVSRAISLRLDEAIKQVAE
jgi:chromosome segregation protein